MKAMKKKAMKKSVIAKGKMAKAMVMRGSKEKTSGGLKKDSLRKNKGGKIVSKRRLIAPRRGTLVAPFRSGRRHARLRARSWGGKTAHGRALYAKTKALYKAWRNIWEAYSCDFRP